MKKIPAEPLCFFRAASRGVFYLCKCVDFLCERRLTLDPPLGIRGPTPDLVRGGHAGLPMQGAFELKLFGDGFFWGDQVVLARDCANIAPYERRHHKLELAMFGNLLFGRIAI